MDLEEKAMRQKAVIEMKKERQKNKRRKNKKPVGLFAIKSTRAMAIMSKKKKTIALMIIMWRNNGILDFSNTENKNIKDYAIFQDLWSGLRKSLNKISMWYMKSWIQILDK